MKKRNLLCSVLLSVTMVLGGTITSFAADGYAAYEKTEVDGSSVDTKNHEVIIKIPQEVIDKAERDFEDQLMMNLNKMRSPSYEYRLDKVGTNVAKKVKIGYAANQPANGTVFSSTGGFYWSDGGNEVSVSFSIGYGVFSMSVSPGKTGTSGEWITSPYLNTPVKLLISKDITVTKYAKYRKPIAGNGGWQYVGDEYLKVPTMNYLDVVKVK